MRYKKGRRKEERVVKGWRVQWEGGGMTERNEDDRGDRKMMLSRKKLPHLQSVT